jgi:hypothetical protein
MNTSTTRGFTRTELVFSLTFVCVLALLLFGAHGQDGVLGAEERKKKMAAQLAKGLEIAKAMGSYAVAGDRQEFPRYFDRDDPSTEAVTANEAMTILLRSGMLKDKQLFVNADSAWCKQEENAKPAPKTVGPGECDWCYVVGLHWNTKKDQWPLLANAFMPDSTLYQTNPRLKGGVYSGTQAIVMSAGGNGEIVETRKKDQFFYIPRADKPAANAFEKDGDWLRGKDLKVLYPLGDW